MAEDGRKSGGSSGPGGGAGRSGAGRSGAGRGGSGSGSRSGSAPSGSASSGSRRPTGAQGTVRGDNSRTTPSGKPRPTGAPGTVRGSNARTVPAGKSSGSRPAARTGGGSSMRTATSGGGRKPNYALRRALAVVVLLAALAFIVWAVIALVGIIRDAVSGGGEPTPEPTATVQPTAEPTPTALSTAAPLPCTFEDLTWAATSSADAGTTVAGTPVTWTFTFTNNSHLACTVDFGPQVVVQTVTSGTDLIWSSAHCGSPVGVLLLLGPGDSTTRTQTWDGTRSQEGCTPVGSAPQPGTYVVTTEFGGFAIAEASTSFNLVAAPAPAPAPEAPAEGEAPPAEGEAPPAEGEAPPAEG